LPLIWQLRLFYPHKNVFDRWKRSQDLGGNIICCWRRSLPAGSIRATYDDPADHRCHLVGNAVVFVDPWSFEGHLAQLFGVGTVLALFALMAAMAIPAAAGLEEVQATRNGRRSERF
tara:strand:+ start:15970 stop:16320 length:351 start_codon:yes stop_codon:yes gene_type:complete